MGKDCIFSCNICGEKGSYEDVLGHWKEEHNAQPPINRVPRQYVSEEDMKVDFDDDERSWLTRLIDRIRAWFIWGS